MNPFEQKLEEYIKPLFKYIFKRNVRPNWLINPKTNRKLELDLYSEEGKIAFELNSKYHHHPKYMDKNRKELDELKIQLCKLNRVRLIIVELASIKTKSSKQFVHYLTLTHPELKIEHGYFI